jgi:aryl-alcohol dehydrogenase-like predicted oxidoreductase
MNQRKLGSQGLTVAEFGLGCMDMSFVNIESRPR